MSFTPNTICNSDNGATTLRTEAEAVTHEAGTKVEAKTREFEAKIREAEVKIHEVQTRFFGLES